MTKTEKETVARAMAVAKVDPAMAARLLNIVHRAGSSRTQREVEALLDNLPWGSAVLAAGAL